MLQVSLPYSIDRDASGHFRVWVNIVDDGSDPVGVGCAQLVICGLTYPAESDFLPTAQSWCDAQNAANLAAQQVQ